MSPRPRVAALLLAYGGTLAAATAQLAVAPGGALTRVTDNRNSFALPAPNLTAKELRDFNFGNRLFNTNWVVAPASVDAFDGLGPTFNRVSCSGCHLRDGRGRPPIEGEKEMLSMLLRLSVPGSNAHGGPLPHPAYGDQLNDRAVPGVAPEGRVEIEYEELAGRYDDGSAYALRKPTYRIVDSAYGALDHALLVSPRTAPHMVGMGLLEAVAEADLMAREDPDDRDGDGISGRANRVWNPITQRTEFGRFGWKANAATLMAQSAGAANGDIGLTSKWFPEQNCPVAQADCGKAPGGGEPELSEPYLQKLEFYLRALAVPARRNADDSQVRQGQTVFAQLQCGACHRPRLSTPADARPAMLAGQEFAPYTDLLLHDLGEGLADGRPDYLASGSEWRTAPLWGLGLVPVVNGHSFYLHDGRARSLEEAVLWHGGEAAAQQRAFLALPAAERAALLAFLGSL
jgi:CxxC motif-containing protein (DUF1111 family)